MRDELNFQIIITGSQGEKGVCDSIQSGIGEGTFSMAGIFSIEELIAAINESQLLISVNTGTAHIAAATQTPVIVLYALTNPQHTPWQVPSNILFFSVREDLRSKNEVVNYVSQHLMNKSIDYPAPLKIVLEAEKLLQPEEYLSRL